MDTFVMAVLPNEDSFGIFAINQLAWGRSSNSGKQQTFNLLETEHYRPASPRMSNSAVIDGMRGLRQLTTERSKLHKYRIIKHYLRS